MNLLAMSLLLSQTRQKVTKPEDPKNKYLSYHSCRKTHTICISIILQFVSQLFNTKIRE